MLLVKMTIKQEYTAQESYIKMSLKIRNVKQHYIFTSGNCIYALKIIEMGSLWGYYPAEQNLKLP